MTRRLFLLALVLGLTGMFAVPAAGADLDTDLARIHEKIALVRSQISTAAADRSEVARAVLEAADALEAAEREVDAASAELDLVRVALDRKNADLADVRSELAKVLEGLAETRSLRDEARSEAEDSVLSAYMGGGTAQPTIAFSAVAVADVSVGVAYLEILTGVSTDAAARYAGLVAEEESDQRDVEKVEDAVSADIADLQSLEEEFGYLHKDLLERRSALALRVSEQQDQLDRLDAEVAHFEGELASLSREESSIRAAIEEAAAPQRTLVVSSSGFVRPVPGAISSGFGMRVHPITGQNRMHNGVDMNAAMGDPIRAAKAGTVILAGVKGGYGNTIMIDHGDGMVTLYAHQSKLGASVGDHVDAGEIIGYAGSTGQSTGPHLHFEVRINGSPVDPTRYL